MRTGEMLHWVRLRLPVGDPTLRSHSYWGRGGGWRRVLSTWKWNGLSCYGLFPPRKHISLQCSVQPMMSPDVVAQGLYLKSLKPFKAVVQGSAITSLLLSSGSLFMGAAQQKASISASSHDSSCSFLQLCRHVSPTTHVSPLYFLLKRTSLCFYGWTLESGRFTLNVSSATHCV